MNSIGKSVVQHPLHPSLNRVRLCSWAKQSSFRSMQFVRERLTQQLYHHYRGLVHFEKHISSEKEIHAHGKNKQNNRTI